MFPLTDTELGIGDLATYWARELPGSPPRNEVVDRTLAAFWRGDLRLTDPVNGGDRRVRLLDAVARCAGHPGLLFRKEGEPPAPMSVELPDGSIEITLANEIVWPPAREIHADDLRTAAYEALAEAKFDDYADLIRPVLYSLKITREAFEAFCSGKCYNLPVFWFSKTSSRKVTAKAKLAKFLRDAAAECKGKRPSKAELRAQAQEKIPGLSARAFDAAWAAHAPASWKKPGPKTR
jgi:hypothetical protein